MPPESMIERIQGFFDVHDFCYKMKCVSLSVTIMSGAF